MRLPKLDRRSMSKGRSLSGEEFDRMLCAVEKHRPNQSTHWSRVLRGLWLDGLRIGECYRLTWDTSDFCVDLERKYPCFQITIAGQKSRKKQTLPLVPEFLELLNEIPKRQRRGRVFRFLSEGGKGISQQQTERIIADFGRLAGVRVSRTSQSHEDRDGARSAAIVLAVVGRWK